MSRQEGKKRLVRLAVIGDVDGSVTQAVTELQVREGVAPGVILVGITAQQLGMGAGYPPPEERVPDFLEGCVPWDWRSDR